MTCYENKLPKIKWIKHLEKVPFGLDVPTSVWVKAASESKIVFSGTVASTITGFKDPDPSASIFITQLTNCGWLLVSIFVAVLLFFLFQEAPFCL